MTELTSVAIQSIKNIKYDSLQEFNSLRDLSDRMKRIFRALRMLLSQKKEKWAIDEIAWEMVFELWNPESVNHRLLSLITSDLDHKVMKKIRSDLSQGDLATIGISGFASLVWVLKSFIAIHVTKHQIGIQSPVKSTPDKEEYMSLQPKQCKPEGIPTPKATHKVIIPALALWPVSPNKQNEELEVQDQPRLKTARIEYQNEPLNIIKDEHSSDLPTIMSLPLSIRKELITLSSVPWGPVTKCMFAAYLIVNPPKWSYIKMINEDLIIEMTEVMKKQMTWASFDAG